MVSRSRIPGRFQAEDQSAVLQVRIPARQLDQLRMLADRDGMLATAVVRDLVLDHLDRQDPDGEFLSVPATQSASGDSLASVTRLPVVSAMTDGEAQAQHAPTASVTLLWTSVDTDH